MDIVTLALWEWLPLPLEDPLFIFGNSCYEHCLWFHVHSVWRNLLHRKHYLLHHPSPENGRILDRYVLHPVLKYTLNRKMMPLSLFYVDLNLVFWTGLCRIELHFISFSNPSFPFLFICRSCTSIECCKIYLVFQTMQVIMNGLVSR